MANEGLGWLMGDLAGTGSLCSPGPGAAALPRPGAAGTRLRRAVAGRSAGADGRAVAALGDTFPR